MAFTTKQRDALKAAIATGQLTVSYSDGNGGGQTLTYRSLAEMRETLRMIEDELAAAGGTVPVRQIRLTSRRGI